MLDIARWSAAKPSEHAITPKAQGSELASSLEPRRRYDSSGASAMPGQHADVGSAVPTAPHGKGCNLSTITVQSSYPGHGAG